MEISKYANPVDNYMKCLFVNYPKTEADEDRIAFYRNHYNEKMSQDNEYESHSFVVKNFAIEDYKAAS